LEAPSKCQDRKERQKRKIGRRSFKFSCVSFFVKEKGKASEGGGNRLRRAEWEKGRIWHMTVKTS